MTHPRPRLTTINLLNLSPCLLALYVPLTWAGSAGKVQFIHGEVTVQDVAGTNRTITKGDTINEGDVISTGANGNTQIRMTDGSIVAVRPNSRLRIDAFQYRGKQDGSERGFFSLLKGGFRAVTGAVGQVNKDNYKVTTPTATIGIRGTDHEPFFVPIGSQEFGAAEPGTYDKVNTGQVVMQTNRGMTLVNPNQIGFVGHANLPPALLPRLPSFYRATSEPTASTSSTDTGSGTSTTSTSTGTSPSKTQATDTSANSTTITTTTGTGTSPTPSNSDRPVEGTLASNTSTVINLTSQQATDATGTTVNLTQAPLPGIPVAVGANIEQTNGFWHAGAGSASGTELRLADDKSLLAATESEGDVFRVGTAIQADRGRASLVFGDTTLPVEWGRWDEVPPGQVYESFDNGQIRPHLGSLHYIYSTGLTPIANLTAAAFGSAAARYQVSGGTRPTSEKNGEVGTLVDMQMVINFSAQTVDGYHVEARFADRTFIADNTAQVPLAPIVDIDLAGKCSGCSAVSEAISGEASTVLIGPNGNAALSSFGLTSAQTQRSAIGTGLLQIVERYATPPLPPTP
ncbi:FecR domain-containing protein, partial [Chitinivorax sp. B]|uniref:FecR family protein n=1 Tax=Chitinivorax sp. B TaxID=2502235 RepID=UPI0010F7CC1B